MNNRMPNYVPLAAALFFVGGCAGNARTPANGGAVTRDGSVTNQPPVTTTAGTAFSTDNRGGRTESSGQEAWAYDVLPTPNPTGKPGHRLNEIGFADDSMALDREGVAICHLTATDMRTRPDSRYLIVGFSHRTETDLDLGQRRADAVRDCLVGDGLDRARFETATFGKQFSGVSDSPHPYMLTAAQGVEIWTLEN